MKPSSLPTRTRSVRTVTQAVGLSLGLLALPMAQAAEIIWAGGSGAWSSPANWIGGIGPETATDSVFIDGGNPTKSAVSFFGGASIGQLIIDAGDSLTMNGGSISLYGGQIRNNGTFTLAGVRSDVDLYADTTLSGSGTTVITTYDGIRSRIVAHDSVLTIAADHVVRGSGDIFGSVVNQGRVIADSVYGALTLRPGSGKTFDNSAGRVQATAGSVLAVSGGDFKGGAIQAGDGATLAISSGSIRSAAIQSSGSVALSGNGVLKDSTLQGNFIGSGLTLDGTTIANSLSIAGNALYASGSIINNGTLSLTSTSSRNNTLLSLSSDTTLSGTGTTLLSSNNVRIVTNTSTLNIAHDQTVRGIGSIVGTVLNHGTLAPGVTVGTLNVNGTLSLANDALLRIDVAGLSQGTQYDLLAVTGNVNLGGTVMFDFGSFEAQVGNSFTFLTFTGKSTGSFSVAQAAGYDVILSYGDHSVTATIARIAPVPEPGSWALMGIGLFALAARGRRSALQVQHIRS